jgi:YggT family protein
MNHILILPFLELINGLLGFYQLLIIIAVIVNLLAAFNILDTYKRGIFVFVTTLNRFTDPVLYQIRRVIPTMGGLDFSPVIALFLINVLQNVIRQIHMYLS